MANRVDPDQTAPIGAVCSGSTLFASILHLSVMLGKYLQQTTSKAVLLLWIFYICSVLCLLCLCARLFICALWSPAGKGLTS